MRILILNEYVKSRGAEQIVSEQMNIFKHHGHAVKCLCFSYSPHKKNGCINDDYQIEHIPKLGKFLFLPFTYIKLRKILQNYAPDIIIIHNIYSSPLTVYPIFKGYKVYQVVHDYKIVCPTAFSILLNRKNKICIGYRYHNCILNCSNSPISFIKISLRLLLVRLNEKLRKKYVSNFWAPSSRMNNVLLKFGYNSSLLNNPIKVTSSLNLRTSLGIQRKLLYVGGVNFEKGILPFVKRIIDSKVCSLDIYGGLARNQYSSDLFTLINSSNGRINYFGCIEHSVLMNKMCDYDFVVVPSLWVDNYPTIILEAMSQSVVVVSSNRGGAADLLSEGRGIIFNWEDEETINESISKIAKLSIEAYNSIIENAYKYVVYNNNYEDYYKKLLSLL